MKKIWSISTTLRNPERLRNFLITLKEMEGEIWDNDAQLEFQIRLIKNRFYGFSNSQFYSNLSREQIDLVEDISKPISMDDAREILSAKNYVDASMRGRNSYKTLEKMGLAIIKEKKICITSLGAYLLSDDYDLGELFFRSFLKWQYPNPMDREFSDIFVYNLKPFILTLQLIKRVNQLCKANSQKEKGISKQEFEIFAQTLTHYEELESQAEELMLFREKLSKIKIYKEQKEFIEQYKEEFLADFSNVENLKDYTDNTIRYFRLTRFIYIRGGGYYIDLEPRRAVEIESLLSLYDGSAEVLSKRDYIEYISDIKQPILPWEEENERQKIAEIILKEVRALEVELLVEERFEGKDVESLRSYRKKLQALQTKKELQGLSKIEETIESLQNIRSLELKPSIALEKYITMALGIINDAKEIRANSLVGDDGEFIFTAPANKPDIECFYESFNAICEVTMLSGRDQWHNEGQPVMRHFREFENSSSLENNYCLFIAPKMHRDTINTFWFALKYEYEGKKQKIVPLSISQMLEILEMIKSLKSQGKSLSHRSFEQFLESVVALKESVATSDEWLRSIPQKVQSFTESYDV